MGRPLRALAWVVAMLVVGELAVRGLGHVMRRDAPVVAERSGGTGVIYCVGDSFTYGQGVQPDQAWPRVLAGLLREQLGADAPQVQTLAEPGRSSSVAVVEVAEALEKGDARLILVLSGWNANDGDFAAHAQARKRAVPFTTTLDLWLLHSRLYRVLKHALTLRGRTLHFDDVEIVPQTTAMSLYDFRSYQEIAQKNLRQIARMCRAAGVPCALLTYPHQPLPANPYTQSEYYHVVFGRTPLSEDDYLLHDRRPGEIAVDAIIREVAESEGLTMVDLQPPFERAGYGGLFLSDWHHPTPAGHALMARTVFDVVAPALTPSAPRH